MADRWFRLYETVVNDPKLQRLPAATFKGLINLWCIASAHDGTLPPVKDIAFTLRISETKAAALVEELRQSGLLDEDEGGIHPHNWNGRQFKSDVSTERVKQLRQRRKAVSGNVSSPLHETPPDTEQRQRQTQRQSSVPNGTGAHAPIDPEKELFDRGKSVLGKDAGGLITRLLKSKDGKVPLARAAIETASTKQDPREYIGAIVRGREQESDQYVDPRLG